MRNRFAAAAMLVAIGMGVTYCNARAQELTPRDIGTIYCAAQHPTKAHCIPTESGLAIIAADPASAPELYDDCKAILKQIEIMAGGWKVTLIMISPDLQARTFCEAGD
jgi:hypothetical protein